MWHVMALWKLLLTLLDCTYDQPSNRRRNPAPQYIEALETRLQRAETLLRTVLPDVDLNDQTDIDVAIAQRQATAKDPTSDDSGAIKNEYEAEQDAQLRSMITSTGQLDLDEHGRWDFHVSVDTAITSKCRRLLFTAFGQKITGLIYI
jgi:hypothetical protein